VGEGGAGLARYALSGCPSPHQPGTSRRQGGFRGAPGPGRSGPRPRRPPSRGREER
jgi:hypothetical protein